LAILTHTKGKPYRLVKVSCEIHILMKRGQAYHSYIDEGKDKLSLI